MEFIEMVDIIIKQADMDNKRLIRIIKEKSERIKELENENKRLRQYESKHQLNDYDYYYD